MRAILQRVKQASVSVNDEVIGSINQGYLLLVGFTHTDTLNDVQQLAKKIAQMRLFSDNEGKMNLPLSTLPDGQILSISQFTLYADCRHGNRPSFINAARPAQAELLYDAFNKVLSSDYHIPLQTGQFGADMQVSLINDGPVTIILDSEELRKGDG